MLLSADEASPIHEPLSPLASRHAEFIALFRGDHGAWISIYGVIGLTLALIDRSNIASVWRHHRQVFISSVIGIGTLVTGAFVVEIAGYYSLFTSDVAQLALEDGLEMVGGSIILVGAATFFSKFVKLRATLPR